MIFIAGGTGFVGRHLLNALKEEGQRVRCLVRSAKKADECKKLGFEYHIGSITDRDSLKGALKGVSTVIHLVGIIEESTGVTFNDVHVKGTENLLDEAVGNEIGLFFYQSALGASMTSPFGYQKTKAEAEELVKNSGLPYLIFRPSLIIGGLDGFSLRMKELIQNSPAIPVPGSGKSLFQPLYIGDWVRCLLKAIKTPAFYNRTIELGGPERISYNELLKMYMEVLGINKKIVHLPAGLVKATLPLSRIGRAFGMKIPQASPDQIDLLQKDNITDPSVIEREFGFKPKRLEEYLDEVFR